jgi:hypothetical protein
VNFQEAVMKFRCIERPERVLCKGSDYCSLHELGRIAGFATSGMLTKFGEGWSVDERVGEISKDGEVVYKIVGWSEVGHELA